MGFEGKHVITMDAVVNDTLKGRFTTIYQYINTFVAYYSILKQKNKKLQFILNSTLTVLFYCNIMLCNTNIEKQRYQ